MPSSVMVSAKKLKFCFNHINRQSFSTVFNKMKLHKLHKHSRQPGHISSPAKFSECDIMSLRGKDTHSRSHVAKVVCLLYIYHSGAANYLERGFDSKTPIY